MKVIIDGVLKAFEETNDRLQPALTSNFITPQQKGSMRGNMMQALLPLHLDGKPTELADLEILGEPTELKVIKGTSYPCANDNIFDSTEMPTKIIIVRHENFVVTEIRYGNHPTDFKEVWTNHRKDGYKMRDVKMKEDFYESLKKIY